MLALTWKMLDLFISVQTCDKQSHSQKLTAIRAINQTNDCLKLRARFCGELKLTSLKQQAQLNQQLTEIGKMIGSWLKNA